jgi:hypothetical protein
MHGTKEKAYSQSPFLFMHKLLQFYFIQTYEQHALKKFSSSTHRGFRWRFFTCACCRFVCSVLSMCCTVMYIADPNITGTSQAIELCVNINSTLHTELVSIMYNDVVIQYKQQKCQSSGAPNVCIAFTLRQCSHIFWVTLRGVMCLFFMRGCRVTAKVKVAQVLDVWSLI